jgi:hypothetical protein
MVRALLMLAPPQEEVVRYKGAVDEIAAAVAALEGTPNLDGQKATVVRALRAATNASFLANGASPPFADQIRAKTTPGPADEQAATAALARARQALAVLRMTRSMEARLAAAAILRALADGLEATAAPSKSRRRTLAEIRFQADRLQKGDSVALDESAWVKAGLAALLGGLAPATTTSGPSLASTWLVEAHHAVESVEDETRFTFQRARIQDAFRTSVDAFAIAIADSTGCQ